MPVGYLVYKHVSWESSPQSKKRMLTHQLTFWASVAAGVTILHKTFFKRGLTNGQKLLRYLLAGAVAAQGFETGERLGNLLFFQRLLDLVNAVTRVRREDTLDARFRVEQGNFHDYRIARMADIPRNIECHILPYGDTPTGMGEMGIPTVAPALTNAIFNACGVRIRKLPIADQLRKQLT